MSNHERSETDRHGNRFFRQDIGIIRIILRTFCVFLVHYSHFIVLNPQLSCFVRKVSVECSETVVMSLHIIGNTFVNIWIISHKLHFHHSDWFQIVPDCWIYLVNNRKQYSAEWNRGLNPDANESKKTRNKKQETKRFSTFAVYRLRHSETKKHCLNRESCLSGTCAKQPINNISEVTWLCTWFPKWGVAD